MVQRAWYEQSFEVQLNIIRYFCFCEDASIVRFGAEINEQRAPLDFLSHTHSQTHTPTHTHTPIHTQAHTLTHTHPTHTPTHTHAPGGVGWWILNSLPLSVSSNPQLGKNTSTTVHQGRVDPDPRLRAVFLGPEFEILGEGMGVVVAFVFLRVYWLLASCLCVRVWVFKLMLIDGHVFVFRTWFGFWKYLRIGLIETPGNTFGLGGGGLRSSGAVASAFTHFKGQ